MYTDMELLDWAASVAGIEFTGRTAEGVPLIGKIGARVPWNPLADDGDEARLEAKLEKDVFWGVDRVYVGDAYQHYSTHGGDKQKARRYAGVY